MKPIKVGFFGFGPRGGSYVDQFLMNDAEIVAICEEREDWLEKARLGSAISAWKERFATSSGSL